MCAAQCEVDRDGLKEPGWMIRVSQLRPMMTSCRCFARRVKRIRKIRKRRTVRQPVDSAGAGYFGLFSRFLFAVAKTTVQSSGR
jgi:hypothetical protein